MNKDIAVYITQQIAILWLGIYSLVIMLKNLPHINPNAAFNLYINLMNLIQRLRDKIQEISDDNDKTEREWQDAKRKIKERFTGKKD